MSELSPLMLAIRRLRARKLEVKKIKEIKGHSGIPDLTIHMLEHEHINKYLYYASEVFNLLSEHNFKGLGWLNGGLVVDSPRDFKQVYRNYSGSTTIYVDFKNKLYYCVDMGD